MAEKRNFVSIPFISFQSRERKHKRTNITNHTQPVSIPFISFQSREREISIPKPGYIRRRLNPFHLFSEQGTKNKKGGIMTKEKEMSQSLSSLFRAGNNGISPFSVLNLALCLNPFHLFSEQGTISFCGFMNHHFVYMIFF